MDIPIVKKLQSSALILASLVATVYFGIRIFEARRPQTHQEEVMHCLELGSDARAAACIKLIQE